MSTKDNHESGLEVHQDEKHLLLEHDYDGIQELNHPLPRWWNAILYVSIAFSVVYFAYYEFLGGASLKDEFEAEYARVAKAQAEFKALHSAFNPDTYAKAVADGGAKKGAVVYETYCMPCHMEGGRGDTGPNLTDKHWLIAKGTPETIYPVVFNGSEANGMPAWSEMISQEEIYQAVAYVMTLKNTFHKEGKAPQGELVEE